MVTFENTKKHAFRAVKDLGWSTHLWCVLRTQGKALIALMATARFVKIATMRIESWNCEWLR